MKISKPVSDQVRALLCEIPRWVREAMKHPDLYSKEARIFFVAEQCKASIPLGPTEFLGETLMERIRVAVSKQEKAAEMRRKALTGRKSKIQHRAAKA